MMRRAKVRVFCAMFPIAGLACRLVYPAEFDGEITVLTPTVEKYEKVEIAYKPKVSPNNPFNPNEVELDALIQTPTGKEVLAHSR